MWRLMSVLLSCWGCSATEQDVDTSAASEDSGPPPSACGDVTDGWDITVKGVVTLRGKPAAGAVVTLTENVWVPGTVHGDAQVDASGLFVLDARDMVSVEDCWGIMLDYTLEARLGDVAVSRNINAPTLGAWTRGESLVDLSEFPFELDDTWIPPSDTGLP